MLHGVEGLTSGDFILGAGPLSIGTGNNQLFKVTIDKDNNSYKTLTLGISQRKFRVPSEFLRGMSCQGEMGIELPSREYSNLQRHSKLGLRPTSTAFCNDDPVSQLLVNQICSSSNRHSFLTIFLTTIPSTRAFKNLNLSL